MTTEQELEENITQEQTEAAEQKEVAELTEEPASAEAQSETAISQDQEDVADEPVEEKEAAPTRKRRESRGRASKSKAQKSKLKSKFAQRIEGQLLNAEGTEKLHRLRTCLTGKIQVYVAGSKERFYLDGSASALTVADGVIEKPECTITISEQDLSGIEEGVLNPQITLLSDKVELKGKASLAIYLFNIFSL